MSRSLSSNGLPSASINGLGMAALRPQRSANLDVEQVYEIDYPTLRVGGGGWFKSRLGLWLDAHGLLMPLVFILASLCISILFFETTPKGTGCHR